MDNFAYLIGGSHDCVKMSIPDEPNHIIDMMKRFSPRVGRYQSRGSDQPILATVETYMLDHVTASGDRIYVAFDKDQD